MYRAVPAISRFARSIVGSGSGARISDEPPPDLVHYACMDPALRRTYYNRCHPFDALEPGDDRYVNIDAIDPQHPIRGEDWVTRLAGRIDLSDRPVYELFTGLPGSGKSTELRRLVRRLQAEHQLLPILIDGEDAIDISNPIDVPDIYFAILHYTEARVLELEGNASATPMQEGYLVRFWNWITRTDVELTRTEFAVSSAAKLVVELRDRPTLRARVRQAVAAHLPRFLDEAHEELRQLELRAVKLGFRGLAVIFDSLEKLRGIGANWDAVMESAERVFGSAASYLRLPVHVLYTIPTALIVRLKIDSVHFLPMIKLRHRDGSRYGPGIDAANMIATRRVPAAALREIFGTQSEQRLDRMISWSGGYPRDIVKLLQLYIGTPVGKWPLSDSDFERVLNQLADDYRRIILTATYEWLARVAIQQDLVLALDADRKTADHLLQNNAVLRYLNDRDWFDVHPAVRQISGVSEEIDRQRNK